MTYLTKIEKQILWRKYLNSGLNPEQSYEKVEEVVKQLKNLTTTLKTSNNTPQEIDMLFKEEFYKICARLDR